VWRRRDCDVAGFVTFGVETVTREDSLRQGQRDC
jgi:hypothetical protein